MKLYTITEMARILKIPPSTASYYKDRHKDFLPFTGIGRKKRYKEESLEALKLIVELASKNTSTEDIEEALNQAGSRIIEVQQNNNNSLTTVPQQPINTINPVKFMKLLDKLVNQKTQIEALQKDVKELKKYIDKYRHRLSWWQELFKKLKTKRNLKN
jgi:DNA-binding transcriptional MerR regulator